MVGTAKEVIAWIRETLGVRVKESTWVRLLARVHVLEKRVAELECLQINERFPVAAKPLQAKDIVREVPAQRGVPSWRDIQQQVLKAEESDES